MMKHLSKLKFRSGMTLIELVVVMGILGILFAAVYMFFVKGTEQFHFTRRQNQLATTGKLALEMISDEVLWAGYMPSGGWTEDQWHPVELASATSFHFYADFEADKSLEDSDHRKVFRDPFDVVHIQDGNTMDRIAGHDIVFIQFNYLDGAGNFLGPMPLDALNRDAVRHVVIKITLQDTYMGDVYQTVMQTIVTPRNLGVYHSFDPLFYMPPPPDAKIVVNIDGDSLGHSPSADQDSLLNRLDSWGYSLVRLSDDQLETFDYSGSGVDLVILRRIANTGSHLSIADTLQAITVPIIALDPDDAVDIFFIAKDGDDLVQADFCKMWKFIPHPIHDDIGDFSWFSIYDNNAGTKITTLEDFETGAELITAFSDSLSGLSGVSVINQFGPEPRRVHYCAYEFEHYTELGWDFLYNVIIWNLPDPSPPLGDKINVEGFEGESPGDVLMTFWEDQLEGGAWFPDSVVLYSDFEVGGGAEMMWSFFSTGAGRIIRMPDNVLQTDRTVTGTAPDRNIVSTILDLSNYSTASDDLYIRLKTWRGTTENISSEEGIFLLAGSGSLVQLVSQNFENVVPGGGDMEFWEDLYGRHRIHCPDPHWGGNSTNFVTMDSRRNREFSRVRMIFELDTSVLNDGVPISVSYMMSDHGDETHSYSPVTGQGDFVGWSLGKGINDPIEDWVNLLPGTQSNGDWYGGNYTFVPPGTMPSTIYVIFGQYDDFGAASATHEDGMSFDDINIVANNNTSNMDRIGIPSSDGGYQNLHIDLDDKAQAAGIQFSSSFAIALSQYGFGSWAQYGILWKNFELGCIGTVYEAPGWSHGPVIPGAKDDWILETILGNHKYTLHANNLTQYSNSVDCWLESPEFSIPSGTREAKLSFAQTIDLEPGLDFCWVEVSTNGGSVWQVVDTPTYNGFFDGHGAYTGYIGLTTTELSLDPYVGQSIKFRFMFHSNNNGVRNGWALDDFVASGIVSGLVIESIGFKPASPGGAWNFDQVDVYLGRVSETSFGASGEWDKQQLTHFGTYPVSPPASGDWVTIDLNDDFILLLATNLLVKLEMSQAAPTAGYSWVTAHRENMTRWETSPGGDPGLLKVGDYRPAFMVNTLSHGQIFVDEDSTGSSNDIPLSFGNNYSDFEGLYLISELGFSSEIGWVHGGLNDDWEIGAPIYTDIDPPLLPSNGNNIAGNDLTDDGLYMDNAWSWIHSHPYDLAEAAVYDSVCVAYDRCLRLAMNDFALIHIAFTDSAGPPLDESGWTEVARYVKLDENWEQDVIQLTDVFQEAIANGKSYYFIRFLIDSGPFAEKGGWNIDNIGFYGRNSN
ncbi:MAG: prepilin-type N-terminal cleavage/methylation domain-containing protein [Candidatus Sabulitectum sp.]|nr:prepilin-type N-terminal cleavage/methylation domain-containing protein [Candidatus Sabulitectum sp.]